MDFKFKMYDVEDDIYVDNDYDSNIDDDDADCYCE